MSIHAEHTTPRLEQARKTALPRYFELVKAWSAGEAPPDTAEVLLWTQQTVTDLDRDVRIHEENERYRQEATNLDARADALDLEIAEAKAARDETAKILATKCRRWAELVESKNNPKAQQYADTFDRIAIITEQVKRARIVDGNASARHSQAIREQADLRAAASVMRQRNVVLLPGEPAPPRVSSPAPVCDSANLSFAESRTARRGIDFETAEQLMALPNMTLQQVATMFGFLDKRGRPIEWEAECESLCPGFITGRIPGWRHPDEIARERAEKEQAEKLAAQERQTASPRLTKLAVKAKPDNTLAECPESLNELLDQEVPFAQISQMKGISIAEVRKADEVRKGQMEEMRRQGEQRSEDRLLQEV